MRLFHLGLVLLPLAIAPGCVVSGGVTSAYGHGYGRDHGVAPYAYAPPRYWAPGPYAYVPQPYYAPRPYAYAPPPHWYRPRPHWHDRPHRHRW